MSFHKWNLALISLLMTTTACTTGIDGGSIERAFSGIKSITVTGPESIQVNWNTNLGCERYEVYRLGTESESSKLADVSIPPFSVKTPYIESERTYSLSVGCVSGSKTSGLNISQNVTTWPKFTGIHTSVVDDTATRPVVILNWSYNTGAPIEYNIYVKKASVPSELTTWQLTRMGAVGTNYSDDKLCSIVGTQARLGDGSCPSLEAGQSYLVKVVAHYPDGTYSNDLAGVGTFVDIPAAFTPPNCYLTDTGNSADAQTSALFLTCDNNAVLSACAAGTLKAHAYQLVNGNRASISTDLTGAGTLRVQPQIATSQLNDRVAENLEIEYSCALATTTQKAIARYNGTNGRFKPVVRYNSDIVRAPAETTIKIPSFYGQSIAVGDFNCDGKPDLAVGMPDVTYAAAPYYNRNAGSGAVAIYYDYATDADGSLSVQSNNIQYLSFRDLAASQRFGASLSAGNVNRDVHFDGSNYYSCDDLIIGAPGDGILNASGAAYIFYGNPQKFPQPTNLSSLSVNSPTCSGTYDSSVCSPVRLVDTTSTQYNVSRAFTAAHFGTAVSYINDFNADGYGDIAIGDPGCGWDGFGINNDPIEASYSNPGIRPGCVFVFWGGQNGIQNINMGHEPGGDVNSYLVSPFAKIYPPIPQDGMQFGASISNGGDIDGALPVPLVNNAGNVVLANGYDFIIGAPNFLYSNKTAEAGNGATIAWTPNTANPVDPITMQGVNKGYNDPAETIASNKITVPVDGAWTKNPSTWNGVTMPLPSNNALLTSRGIAFAYLGRSSQYEYQLKPTQGFVRWPIEATINGDLLNPFNLISANLYSRQNGSRKFTIFSNDPAISPQESFYNCGTRGNYGGRRPGTNSHLHISCFAGRNNTRWIYPLLKPTDAPVVNFGSNVAIASSREQNSNLFLNIVTRTDEPYRLFDNSTRFQGQAQGNIHERIKGDSMWELGNPFYNVDGTRQGCLFYNNTVSSDVSEMAYDGVAACNYIPPVRSAIKEEYAGMAGADTSTPGAIRSDINRDGYGDVLVTYDSGMYTYFGNYAADLTAGDVVSPSSPYSVSSSCNVSRLNVTPAPTDSTFTISNKEIPYQTFTRTTNVVAGMPHSYTISSTYPVLYRNNLGNASYRNFRLGEIGLYTNLDYSGAVTYTAGITTALNNCKAQKKTFTSTPTSISVTDLNDDRVTDVVVGFSGDSNTQGAARSLISATEGIGFVSEGVYNDGATAASRSGATVAATNWRFLASAGNAIGSYEKNRKDLFVGAPFKNQGDGSVIGYTGRNGESAISSSSSLELTSSIKVAFSLHLEYSRIIGDINGDGFDDILVPVKRFNAQGLVYYDAIIYYGSSFGSISTPYCLAHVNDIKFISGSSISSSDCNPSAIVQTAFINNLPIKLPQYITTAAGMPLDWALNVYPAGDIDRDGKDDIMVGSSNNILIAMYGSDLGLVGGPPARGLSNNHSPQLISNSAMLVQVQTSDNAPHALYIAKHGDYSFGNYSIAHGDFNGDGFQDIAVGIISAPSARLNGTWNCSSESQVYSGYCGYHVGGNSIAAANPGPAIPNTGHIVVIYGSEYGLQIPTNTLGQGIEFDLDPTSMKCDNFYKNCKKVSDGSFNPFTTARIAYGTLTDYDQPTGMYQMATTTDGTHTKPACTDGTTATSSSTCDVATYIPNPLFANTLDSYLNLRYSSFGATITVADVNNDGIDDLVIGHGNGNDVVNTTTSPPAEVLYPSTPDAARRGAAYIYYGAKNRGIVAPFAHDYIGNGARGVDTGANALTNKLVFKLYPKLDGSHPLALDTSETNRQFGINTTSGDFNGDGVDDIAFASANGQIYVYYGPICALDNTATAITSMSTNINKAPELAVGAQTTANCFSLNFNGGVSAHVMPTKRLYPQVLQMNGIDSSMSFGNTLIAKRKGKGNMKQSGFNLSGQKASDLIIGTPWANDNNATFIPGKYTGLGYVFFGHTAGDPSFNTKAGLYVGNPSYNTNMTTVSGYQYLNPILLRPHESDSSISNFFRFMATTGDINGDGRMDTLYPTYDVDQTQNQVTAPNGGGYRLTY